MKTIPRRSSLSSFCLAGLILSFASSSFADSYFGGLSCKPSEAYLIATNKSAPSTEVEPFWLQHLGSQPFTEKVFEVAGGRSEVFPLGQTSVQDSQALALKTRRESQWEFKSFCSSDRKLRALENKTSPWKSVANLKVNGGKKPTTASLTFVSLSQQEQQVEVQFFYKNHSVLKQTLKAAASFSQTRFDLKMPRFADRAEIRAEGRWTGTLEVNRNQEPVHELALTDETVQKTTTPGERYFLVRSQTKSDLESFVVPMTNPALIAEALEQIAGPSRNRLLVARIEKSLKGPNRDFVHPNKTPWSWQIQEALQFGDLASIVCDGNPSMVEERIDDWMLNAYGNICFWNYRVVQELTAAEVEGR